MTLNILLDKEEQHKNTITRNHVDIYMVVWPRIVINMTNTYNLPLDETCKYASKHMNKSLMKYEKRKADEKTKDLYSS